MAIKLAPDAFDFPETSDPANPPAGYMRVYANAGAMMQRDSAGTETPLGGGSMPLHNWTGADAPLNTDDETLGYSDASLWFNGQKMWYCSDPTTGNAIWREIVNTTTVQTLLSKTLTSPSIAFFNNAQHDHTDAFEGGTLSAAAIASGTLVHERGGLEADVSAYSGLIKISGGATSQAVADTDYAAATHASRHESGGADEIDGGALETAFNPTNYTETDTTLDGHLEGIDDALAGAGLYTSVAILRDEKSTGTNGGSSSATTWNNRNLNTEVYDPDNIVSISSNQFTPIAGDYKLTVWSVSGAATASVHRLRVYNVTGAASVEEGLNTTAAAASRTVVMTACKFTANGTDAYRIDHYTTVGQATNGLGAAASDGSAEVYMEIILRKLA